jgi:hypothetical protein
MEFAWLDLFGGRWLLLNGDLQYPARSWADEDAALAQLEEEGWIITGPHRKQLSMIKQRRRSRGYAMTRTVH